MHLHLHKYITRKKEITVVDKLMGLAAVVHPLSAVPQVYQIYSTHNVAGISLLTWFSFMLLGLVFLFYGILHNIKPFIVTQVLWFIVDGLVVLGVLLYR